MNRKSILLACPDCDFEMAWQRGDKPYCPVCLLNKLNIRLRMKDNKVLAPYVPFLDTIPKMEFKPKRG